MRSAQLHHETNHRRSHYQMWQDIESVLSDEAPAAAAPAADPSGGYHHAIHHHPMAAVHHHHHPSATVSLSFQQMTPSTAATTTTTTGTAQQHQVSVVECERVKWPVNAWKTARNVLFDLFDSFNLLRVSERS